MASAFDHERAFTALAILYTEYIERAFVIEGARAQQVVGGEVGRADAQHMRIAGEAVEVFPCLAPAIAGDVVDRHGNVEQPPRIDGLHERARRAVQPAAGRRARDDLHRALRAPGACRRSH